MVEKFKQLSLIVLLVEIIFSSDLYAQSFKERLRQAVRQEYNSARQRNNNRNQYQNNSTRYQYNKTQKKDNNANTKTENTTKSQDEVVLTVFGFGNTKDEATKIALRSAIEQAFGAFVSSNTQILNDSLVSDEIATVSSGNIKHYEYISEQKYDNGYSVGLKATISINKLINYAESKGSIIEFAGNAFAMNMTMYELNKTNEVKAINHLYKEISSQTPYLYDYKISTSSPKKNKEGKWEIPITVTIYANKTTQNIYNLILNTFNSISISEKEWKEYKGNGLNDCARIILQEEKDVSPNIPRFNLPIGSTKYIDDMGRHKLITLKYFYFRNSVEPFNRLMEVLSIEAQYQTIAFTIVDDLKTYQINITNTNEYFNAFKGSGGIVHDLNKYCSSSIRIDNYKFISERWGNFNFPKYFMQPLGNEIMTIKLSLIYNSLDEIKRLKNISIEPTHKSFTELKYEQ